ncbi:MAG: DUF1759 domain-containing protein, partial [Planctomycetaceae bacterium]|nr:DUF1759 domain-containing protein [Planctomycetaceae bacterium]
MQSLLKLQSLPNQNTEHLRKIYDEINVHVRGLQSLGMPSESYGSLLIPLIMARMPKEIAIQVARKTSEGIWKIEEILQILEKEIEAREIGAKISAAAHESKTERNTGYDRANATKISGTTKAFVAQTRNESRKISCLFCKKEHWASECSEVVKDVKKRKELIANAKRCFRCLRMGHRANQCQSNRVCKICKGPHHPVLCTSPENQAESTSNVLTATTSTKNIVLMQTATAFVVNGENGERTKATILFDSGSQKSYVTKDLMNRLKLKPRKTEAINLNTFGSESFRKVDFEVVSFDLGAEGGDLVSIAALSNSVICTPIATRVNVGEF